MSKYDDEVEACNRKINALGPPRESWLRSDDPYKYAAAMGKCRHPGGFCSQDGFCHYGDCFKRPSATDRLAAIEERLSKIEKLIKQRRGCGEW